MITMTFISGEFVQMTQFDQFRAYLTLRENIASLRREIGDDQALKALALAVKWHLDCLKNLEAECADDHRQRRV
jgi:hypothetical protein